MIKNKTLKTIEEIKAFSDPYRLKILNHLYMLGIPATVKQIADSMGEVPANVHYHMKKLEKFGIVTMVDTKIINGIVAKYYEPSAFAFNIVDKTLSDNSKKVYKAELEKFIDECFNKAETIFIDQLRKQVDNKNVEGIPKCMLSEDYIYMTKEEADIFKQYITDFVQQHSKKDSSKDKDKYHVFSSIVFIEK